MPDTREEAVRREFEKWAQEQIPKIADGGGNLPLAWLSWQASREAALREAIGIVDDALNCECGYSDNRSKSKYNTECGHAMNCPKYLVYELLAIPVAGKKEKA